MFMNDVNKKDEIRHFAIEDLRKFGIKCRPKKLKLQGQETKTAGRVFKTPLHVLPKQTVTLPTGQQLVVPKLVHEMCSFISARVETEGLFRKGGSKCRQTELRLMLDSGCFLEESHHVIDVANVLKTFFRELPEPLFPYAYHESFLRCMLLSENNLKALLLTCLLLPSEHLNILTYFLQFLNNITKYSAINKMDSYNLAVVIGPTIFPMENKLHNTALRLTKICELFKLLIENACSIGLISESIIDRIAPLSTSANSLSDDDINIKNRRKKKRRSGSLTRMFNGLRKIVGSKSIEDSMPQIPATPDLLKTPNLQKSTKKRKLEAVGFSNKKKLEVLQNLPQGTALSTPISINPNPKRTSPRKSISRNGDVTKEKKSHWSLSSRHTRFSKEISEASNLKRAVGTKSALERRWSAVSQATVFKRNKARNSCDASSVCSEIKSSQSPETENCCDLVIPEKSDYIKISISEYEEIKNRVSALERQISVELDQYDNKNVQIENHFEAENLKSLIQVQTAYEKTLTEAEQLSPTTDLLARRFSKELKIRRSAENKIVRSPSARKIGNLRRRSKELEKQNTKIQRHQSWHVQSVESMQRVSLRRGRPNTVVTGLRDRTPLRANRSTEQMDFSFEPFTVKTVRSSLPTDMTPSPRPTPEYSLRSTDKNSGKWRSAEGFFCKLKTPVDANPSVRSSIARLRSQNAGMVLAKAKLFDGLTDSDNSANSFTTVPQIRTGNKIGAARNSARTRSFKCDERYCSRHSTSPRKKYVKSPNFSTSFQLIFAEKENHLQSECIHKDVLDSTEKSALKDANPNCVRGYATPTEMPRIKSSLTNKSPKRICSIPISQNSKQTPLKAISSRRVY